MPLLKASESGLEAAPSPVLLVGHVLDDGFAGTGDDGAAFTHNLVELDRTRAVDGDRRVAVDGALVLDGGTAGDDELAAGAGTALDGDASGAPADGLDTTVSLVDDDFAVAVRGGGEVTSDRTGLDVSAGSRGRDEVLDPVDVEVGRVVRLQPEPVAGSADTDVAVELVGPHQHARRDGQRQEDPAVHVSLSAVDGVDRR